MTLKPLAALGCLLLSSCGFYFSQISITNDSNFVMRNVTLRARSERLQIVDIPAHNSVSISEHFPGNGDPVLTFTAGEAPYRTTLCYYTDGAPIHAEVRFSDDLPWVGDDGLTVDCQ